MNHSKPSGVNTGRARGIAKAKAKLQRITRRVLNRESQREDPALNQPRKIRNFWWEWL